MSPKTPPKDKFHSENQSIRDNEAYLWEKSTVVVNGQPMTVMFPSDDKEDTTSTSS